jgi:hypothetical protein
MSSAIRIKVSISEDRIKRMRQPTATNMTSSSTCRSTNGGFLLTTVENSRRCVGPMRAKRPQYDFLHQRIAEAGKCAGRFKSCRLDSNHKQLVEMICGELFHFACSRVRSFSGLRAEFKKLAKFAPWPNDLCQIIAAQKVTEFESRRHSRDSQSEPTPVSRSATDENCVGVSDECQARHSSCRNRIGYAQRKARFARSRP